MDAAPPPPSRPIARLVERARQAEREIDQVIDKIDQALPKILQQAEDSKLVGRPPSGEHSTAEIRRARQAFAEMSEDSLLTRSGQDIQMPDSEPEMTPAPGYAKPKAAQEGVPSPSKRRLHFRKG